MFSNAFTVFRYIHIVVAAHQSLIITATTYCRQKPPEETQYMDNVKEFLFPTLVFLFL